jgi:hypothetical protein
MKEEINRFRSKYDGGVTSFRAEDLDPRRWPYRHPQRWGEKVKWPFTMLHDIYSLGVVLLEIGLWQSLIKPVADSEAKLATDNRTRNLLASRQ